MIRRYAISIGNGFDLPHQLHGTFDSVKQAEEYGKDRFGIWDRQGTVVPISVFETDTAKLQERIAELEYELEHLRSNFDSVNERYKVGTQNHHIIRRNIDEVLGITEAERQNHPNGGAGYMGAVKLLIHKYKAATAVSYWSAEDKP